MRMKRVCLSLMLIAIAAFGQGCVAAAVGIGAVGTFAYIQGALESTEPESVEKVYLAALKAVDQLDLHLISQSEDVLSAKITARDSQDKKIQINMSATPDLKTKLSIRVDIFGDEKKSILVYKKIYNNLHPINNSRS
jgi:hypothetical protein